MRQVRRGVIALVFVIALTPLTAAYAEDGNQAAIEKAKAEQQWLDSMPQPVRGVAMGQHEITNARAIARLLSFDKNAQMEIPNSMEMYRAFCAQAIVHMQANLHNAEVMASNAVPGDLHARAELANANVRMRELWEMIGDSYPGNPYRVYADDGISVADDGAIVADEDVVYADGDVMVADDSAVVADESVMVADDEAVVATDGDLDLAIVEDGGN